MSPTGYTDIIYSTVHHPEKGKFGQPSFEEFALRCARAFGAFVDMRDMSLDAETPEVLEEHSHYHDKLLKAYARRAEVATWTQAQATTEAKKSYGKAKKHHDEYIAGAKLLKERYEEMLQKVRDWEPPSEDHQGLKTFMIEQLEQSIDFDCNVGYWEKNAPKLLGGAEYKRQQLDKATEDIDYYQKEKLKEAERTQNRNEWIASLRASLGGVKV